jgi:protein-S-isoprenylcysteine O-methyltransferase Ste14
MPMHLPPVFAYDESIIFWIVYFWSFFLEILHSGIIAGDPLNKQDAGTMRLINIGSNISLILAFCLAFLPWFVIPYPRIALDTGTVLLIVGSLLRRYCFRILGEYFTAAVTVTADQPVITRGPYRWIRHPGYTAGFIMFIGIGLALGNWLSLSTLFIVLCFVYSRRIRAEEEALLSIIGEPYRAYMATTKRLIPLIF